MTGLVFSPCFNHQGQDLLLNHLLFSNYLKNIFNLLPFFSLDWCRLKAKQLIVVSVLVSSAHLCDICKQRVYKSVPKHTMPPRCSPLSAFPSIGLPLSPLSSSSTSSDTPKAARFAPQGVEDSDSLPPGFAEDVADKLEEFLVAVPGFTC